MMTDFTLKETFYSVQQVLRVDTVTKYAEYYIKVDGIMKTPQMVDYHEVSDPEKAAEWLKKSPSSLYATRIEYLHAFRKAV